jgi:predicted dehydrogenase
MKIRISGAGNIGGNPIPVYAADSDAEGVRQALASASSERRPEWRAKAGGKAAQTD